ncbi:hypothetical protein DITRI_Ditri03aG0202800 [Diplodiscus trichospermus]
MKRFSQRESVLLGYSPQQTFMDSSSAPRTPGRNSDIDFNDVFGGPPRRSSNQETRYSSGENTDHSSPSSLRTSDETVAESGNPWSGLSEKPVFGEEGMSRRRYSKSDFFDDIFRGNESLSSSPWKHAMKDPFTPGSHLSSPARPLPPKAEPFGSSFAAQFSLPVRLNKGMDLPTFGSPTRTTSKSKDAFSNASSYYSFSPLSRFSGQANQDKEEMRNGFQSSSRLSALSQELSTGCEQSANVSKHDETGTKGNTKEDSNSSEISKNGSQFHFSIYKWANKGGVPLAVRLRGSDIAVEKDKLQRCSSANGWIACESIAKEPKEERHNSLCFTDGMPSNGKSVRVELDKNENGSLFDSRNGDGEQGRVFEEDNIPKSESEMISKLKRTDMNISGGEEKTHYPLPEVCLSDKREQKASAFEKGTHKPRSKILKLLLENDDPDKKGDDEITRNAGREDISEKSAKKLPKNINKQGEKKKAIPNNVEASKTSVKHSPGNSWDNGKGRVRGRVKEFIKIFNQDASSKPRKDTVLPESYSSTWSERDTIKPENESRISITERDEKIRMPNMQNKKSFSDVPVATNKCNVASEKNIKSSVTDTVSDGSKTIVEDPTDSFEDNFLIEDLTPEEKILPQFGIDPEERKAIGAKILQWSNGKQGNIRSLLSTLQYVLWPDSGWKPVPLVDIIEAPAVKRSYQKALLCLHPDKLQQKGAASDKKYIAEKVFDILQDAWTHFNSLGSV